MLCSLLCLLKDNLLGQREETTSRLRSFLRHKIERKIFVQLLEVVIRHAMFRNIK